MFGVGLIYGYYFFFFIFDDGESWLLNLIVVVLDVVFVVVCSGVFFDVWVFSVGVLFDIFF